MATSKNYWATVTAFFDGTPETYYSVMKEWFRKRGAATANPEELTALCDEWYAASRQIWIGWSEAPLTSISTGTTVTKGGDNEGMEVVPSTETEHGNDDYAGLPLFACVDCNFEVDADTLQPVITAIEGITPGFRRFDPDVYVGVLQASGWIFQQETEQSYLVGVSAYRDCPFGDVRPYASAINPDGSVRQWIVSAKYQSQTVNSKLTSYSGAKPTGYISHNSSHTLSKANGDQYSGYTSADDEFIKTMTMLKYGLTLDGVMQGCCNMNYQYYAQVSEEDTNRVIMSTANGANMEPGMICLIGTYSSSQSSPTDRGTSTVYNISGQAGWQVTKVETIEIDEEEYVAVYFDTDGDTFSPVANGSATDGSTLVSTFRWPTGITDDVKGNDGSYKDNTSGKYPYKIQGIELMNGGYDIVSDVILQPDPTEENPTIEPYICDMVANQSTAITSYYRASGIKCPWTTGTSAAWQYIKRNMWKDGMVFPIEVGGSSSTFTRDGFYQAAITTTSIREMLVRGVLNLGTSNAGASCVHGAVAVSAANWHYGARLSACGSRGEWQA